jgi:purine-cytosine permease-like protein
MTFLWILLAIVYVACWVYFGLATFRKGHYWLFWIGFFLPFLWIIGALIAPTQAAAGRAARHGMKGRPCRQNSPHRPMKRR